MKETKIEKLILDLSTRWECSPQEAVDRLNSMNESEINKLINSMTNKFKNGGFIDCLRNGGSVSKCKCGCNKIVKDQHPAETLGKKFAPEVKPGGLKGFFWQPQEYPRVESFDYLDGKFTGTKSWYYDQDGNEHQILNKVFPAGNTASTELLIKNPGTSAADSVMTITNQYGKRTIKDMKDAVKFLPAFEKNFKCGGSLPKKNNTKK